MKIKPAITALALFVCLPGMSADWPTWRGPQQNSTTTEQVSTDADFSKALWTAEVGEGYASISVCAGKVLTAGNRNEQGQETDVITCLDEKTGRKLWEFTYPCRSWRSYPGPRATPVTDGTRVFMLSSQGDLNCISLDKGKKLWSLNVAKKHGARNLGWGFSGSVAIKGDRIYVNAGEKGMAFEKATGKPAWPNRSGQGGYAAPVPFTFQNQNYLAMFSAKKLYVLKERDGSEVTSIPWVTNHDVNAADPLSLINGKYLFVSSGYRLANAMLKFDGKSLKPIWENQNMASQFATPVMHGNVLYGASGNTGRGRLCAVIAKTGELAWTSKVPYGSPLLAANLLVYFDERGKLYLINPNRQKLDILKSAQIFQGAKCWTMPVVANGRMYLRNVKGNLNCYKVD
jgi:outer membrane protein assembly factor BamB